LIGIAFIALIPVVAYYVWARYLSLTYPPYHFAGSGNWIWDEGFMKWYKQLYFLPKLEVIFVHWFWGLPFIGLILLGLLISPPKFSSNYEDGRLSQIMAPWFFHIWFAACIFYYFIGAKELVGNPWNFHILNPVAAVFAGRALVIMATYQNTKIFITVFRIGIVTLIIGISNSFILKNIYSTKYAIASYHMGLELKKVSKPHDLVVTMAQNLGDPVSIYYSRCKGWVFPPADKWAPSKLPDNDQESIQAIEQLRNKGADWFGIVNQHYQDIQTNHPAFYNHITKTCKLHSQTSDYVIFQMQFEHQLSVK
jgi:hypothetical protein